MATSYETPSGPEFSERARYVTEQVSLWIANDSDYYEMARYKLKTYGVTDGFADYLKRVITNAPEYSAPWQVAQELSPNDYRRIRWDDVAAEIVDQPRDEHDPGTPGGGALPH